MVICGAAIDIVAPVGGFIAERLAASGTEFTSSNGFELAVVLEPAAEFLRYKRAKDWHGVFPTEEGMWESIFLYAVIGGIFIPLVGAIFGGFVGHHYFLEKQKKRRRLWETGAVASDEANNVPPPPRRPAALPTAIEKVRAPSLAPAVRPCVAAPTAPVPPALPAPSGDFCDKLIAESIALAPLPEFGSRATLKQIFSTTLVTRAEFANLFSVQPAEIKALLSTRLDPTFGAQYFHIARAFAARKLQRQIETPPASVPSTAPEKTKRATKHRSGGNKGRDSHAAFVGRHCGNKIRHPSAKSARGQMGELKSRGERGLAAYKCEVCSGFHVGHGKKK